MKINGNTKISHLIKENKEAIEVIASLNPHFTKLRNPILRRVLAPRVTIAEASRIGKCEMQEMLDKLATIGFELDDNIDIKEGKDRVEQNSVVQRFLKDKSVITLDVRPYLAKGEDPFSLIQNELKNLAEDHVLEILIDFEPIPLIRIQEKKGYQTVSKVVDGVYHTYFKSGSKEESVEESVKGKTLTVSKEEYEQIVDDFKGEIIPLDVRDLEMPGPMVLILETVAALNADSAIKVYHKRIPQHLLPELEDKNLNTFIYPVEEGNVMLFITRDHVQPGNK